MPQPPGHCVFCDYPGVTAEHLIPEALHDVIGRGSDNHEHVRMLLEDVGATDDPSKFLVKARGPLRSRKLRIACADCNNIWMSAVESNAHPLLRALMHGGGQALSSIEQLHIARWAVLRSIVYQYTNRDRIAVPFRDRLMLSTGHIPEGWQVWIGWMQPEMIEPYFGQRMWGQGPREDGEVGLNSATTAIGLKQLALYALRTPYPDMYEDHVSDYAGTKMMQLWPRTTDVLQCTEPMSYELLFKVPDYPMMLLNNVPPHNYLDGCRYYPYRV